MARRRNLAFVVVLALAVFGAPGIAHAAVPKLTGTTVLKGAYTGSMRVRVVDEAIIDLTPVRRGGKADAPFGPAALAVDGGGSGYTGFLLTEPGNIDGLAILAVRTPRRLHDGLNQSWAVGHGRAAQADRGGPTAPSDGSCVVCKVPPGVYDLRLITTGSDAAVTITAQTADSRRTVLRPDGRGSVFSWSSRMRSPKNSDSLWEGGGMAMGLGWGYGKENGLLLSTYEFEADARTAVMAGSVEACRSVKNEETCEDQRVLAGDRTSVAGSGISVGKKVDDVSAALTFDSLGGAAYEARVSMLWVTVTSSRPAPTMEFAPAGAGGLTRWRATY